MIDKTKLTEICNKHGVKVIGETVSKSKPQLSNMSAGEQANKIHWEWKLAVGEW